MISLSRTQGHKYWFHTLNRQSVFECPRDASPDFAAGFSGRLIWDWTSGCVRIRPDQEVVPGGGQGSKDRLHGEQLMSYINTLMG